MNLRNLFREELGAKQFEEEISVPKLRMLKRKQNPDYEPRSVETKKLRPKTSTNKFKKPTPSNSTQSHGSRIWTDITGNFTREASFIELAEGKVTLQLTDGRRTIISFEILSKKDQEYVLDIGDSQ